MCGTQLEKQLLPLRTGYEVDVSHSGLVLMEPDHQDEANWRRSAGVCRTSRMSNCGSGTGPLWISVGLD